MSEYGQWFTVQCSVDDTTQWYNNGSPLGVSGVRMSCETQWDNSLVASRAQRRPMDYPEARQCMMHHAANGSGMGERAFAYAAEWDVGAACPDLFYSPPTSGYYGSYVRKLSSDPGTTWVGAVPSGWNNDYWLWGDAYQVSVQQYGETLWIPSSWRVAAWNNRDYIPGLEMPNDLPYIRTGVEFDEAACRIDKVETKMVVAGYEGWVLHYLNLRRFETVDWGNPWRLPYELHTAPLATMCGNGDSGWQEFDTYPLPNINTTGYSAALAVTSSVSDDEMDAGKSATYGGGNSIGYPTIYHRTTFTIRYRYIYGETPNIVGAPGDTRRWFEDVRLSRRTGVRTGLR